MRERGRAVFSRSAHEQHRLEPRDAPGKGLQNVHDLSGELPGGGDNDGADLVPFERGLEGPQAVDEREHKSQGLAGAGAGVDGHVLVASEEGDAGLLDRSRPAEAEL